MKELTITWQRLIDSTGSTCPRCAGTQQQVQQAMDRLRAAGYARSFTPLEEGVRKYVLDHLVKDDPYV